MIGNIIGGALGAAGSLLGASKQNKAISAANHNNYMAQKEFAQNGIQWKVEDAKKAGLHPLYALGASGATYSPSSQVGTEGVSGAFRSVGQSISNMQSSAERAFQKLDLKGKQLDNQYKQELINNLQKERMLASMGQSPGGAAMNEIVEKGVPKKINKAASAVEGIENVIPGFRLVTQGNGGFNVEPSKDRADWLQDFGIANAPDSLYYIASKYNVHPTSYAYWQSQAYKLTQEARKRGELKDGGRYVAKYGPQGWHFKKVNSAYRTPERKLLDGFHYWTDQIKGAIRRGPIWMRW